MPRLFLISALILFCPSVCMAGGFRQDTLVRKVQLKDTTVVQAEEIYTREYLDTVSVASAHKINDYPMIGFEYGISGSQMLFNPTKKQQTLFTPRYFGVMFTKYGKMFGYMPYFGVSAGLFYGQDGYKTKPSKEGVYPTVDGAIQAVYDYVEVPVLAHFHIDAANFKLMVDGGFFGGYRLKVHRTGDGVPSEYIDSFYDYDRRIDYGLKGGAGFGLMFDPVEIHIMARVRWSESSLYKPDYNSAYYYRFANPLDVTVTAGLYFQLGKRKGRTKAELRQAAKEQVWPETSDSIKK